MVKDRRKNEMEGKRIEEEIEVVDDDEEEEEMVKGKIEEERWEMESEVK